MEIDDKLAYAIHGIRCSDSESDFDSTEDFDQEYKLLKPPTYDYESIRDKIILITSEENYKTDKWQVEVIASNNIRVPQFIKLNKQANQENIPSNLEPCAIHSDHNFYKRVDGTYNVDRQTSDAQKKASTIPEVKPKSKSELKSDCLSLQEASKEDYYYAGKYNVSNSVTANFNDGISKKKKKKKFKPFPITFFSYEDSSSQINLNDSKNNFNWQKIEGNFNDIESDGNTYKRYNSWVGFERSKNENYRIFREHRLSSREWMNTANDPLENDICKLSDILKSNRGLDRIESELLNSPTDNRIDKKSWIPREIAPNHITRQQSTSTVQRRTSRGISKEIKVDMASEFVSEQKKNTDEQSEVIASNNIIVPQFRVSKKNKRKKFKPLPITFFGFKFALRK